MKKILFLAYCILSIGTAISQNVGIGTGTPTEKLDVNGNVNISGQLKVSGDAGSKNQVLMKDASNNLVWGDISEFKNIWVNDCGGIATSPGTSNCSTNWTVPAGVTTILVECWGGGGGGSTMSGGGGGGYISARLTVTPGAILPITIGAGGNLGNATTTGIMGGTTSFTVSPTVLYANGGQGGKAGDVLGSPTNGQPSGGNFSVFSLITNYIGYYGNPGGITKLGFMVAGATDYAKVINYGDGGDAPLLPGSGGKGGFKIASASINQITYASQYGVQPGAGGGADPTGGFYGLGGRVIIHY
jgi:hypothetical protein